MKNKKIAILIENYLAGGCDKIARDLIDNLKYEKLYLFINKDSDLKILLNRDLPKNVELITYSLLSIPKLGLFANNFKRKSKLFYIVLKAFNLLIRYPLILFYFVYFYFLLKKFDLDVFFSNNGGYPGGEFNRVATLSFSLFGKPNYHIVHNLATKPFFKLFTPIEYFIDWLLDKSATFICVSNQTRDVLLQNRFIKQQPIVIYNGIKSSTKQNNKLNNGTIKLLSIGLLGKRKNQLELIEVMNILKQKDYSDIELYLLGDEEDIGYKKQLNEKIRQYELKNIHLEGFCDPVKYYKMCDIFVLSSMVESFALVRVEAMSYQMPVITTDVGDAHLQIKNGKNGYIVNNVLQFANAIEIYLQNKEMILQHGDYGHEIFKNRFTLDKMIEEYQKLVDGE